MMSIDRNLYIHYILTLNLIRFMLGWYSMQLSVRYSYLLTSLLQFYNGITELEMRTKTHKP